LRFAPALFSIFLPGCGQIFNGHVLRGILFLLIECVINVAGRINAAIHADFMGRHQEALAIVNYDYMLFYPPFYVYVTWDAVYHARPGLRKGPSAVLFLIAGIAGEMGAIYADLLPFPTLTIGLIMIIPMLIGTAIVARK